MGKGITFRATSHWCFNNQQQENSAMSGTTDTVKGRAKEAVGVVTNNQRLKDEGRLDQAVGKVKKAVKGMIDKVKR
jgi:uncharacterized protein YjbJ (UPF0337 family)